MSSYDPPPGDASERPTTHDGQAHVRDEYVRPVEPLPISPEDGLARDPRSQEDAPVSRRVRLPVILFLATCLSTWWAGAVELRGSMTDGRMDYADQFIAALRGIVWYDGVKYMLAVMGILLAHEMGHFLMTLRHRVPASLPFFIPMPHPPFGTMGAVIAMQGSRADRRQLFDIGLAGPLAGLLIAIPVLCAGIYRAEPVGPLVVASIVTRPDGGEAKANKEANLIVNQPLVTRLLVPIIRPDLAGETVRMNSLMLAGWLGMLITGLNMLPVSQLDGGHVIYALVRRRSYHVANAFLFLAIAYIVMSGQMMWVLMLSLIVLIGIYHPPTANDHARLGRLRTALGWASLLIPVLCFPPRPFELDLPWEQKSEIRMPSPILPATVAHEPSNT